MPRGNDAAAAGRELEARLGVPLNAEAHIKTDGAKWPAELRVANKMQINEQATEALDESVAQNAVGEDREVLGYAVRSKYLVVISADAEGVALKQAFPLADLDEGAQKPARRASGASRVKAARR